MTEHAVIVNLPADQPGLDLDSIEDPLIAATEASGIGEFDGDLIGPENGKFATLESCTIGSNIQGESNRASTLA